MMKSKCISFLILAFTGVLSATANDWTHHAIRAGVAYLTIDVEKDLEIDAPAAEGAKRDELVVSIDLQGGIQLQGKACTLEALQMELGKLARVKPDLAVRVRSDAKTDFKQIVKVIDRCRKAGVWNLSFATRDPDPKPKPKPKASNLK